MLLDMRGVQTSQPRSTGGPCFNVAHPHGLQPPGRHATPGVANGLVVHPHLARASRVEDGGGHVPGIVDQLLCGMESKTGEHVDIAQRLCPCQCATLPPKNDAGHPLVCALWMPCSMQPSCVRIKTPAGQPIAMTTTVLSHQKRKEKKRKARQHRRT